MASAEAVWELTRGCRVDIGAAVPRLVEEAAVGVSVPVLMALSLSFVKVLMGSELMVVWTAGIAAAAAVDEVTAGSSCALVSPV